jgi:DNA-3-methyladenine glycosylase II
MKRVSSAGRQSRSSIEQRLSRADPALGRVIAAVNARLGPPRIKPSEASPFESLVRAVVYQSVSGKVAATIFARLKTGLGGSVRPGVVTKITSAGLVSVGLSGSKARAIRGLADWFCDNPATARRLAQLPDEKIATWLTSIPGIGLWTVNVFLIFSLARPDVIPAADKGIRRGVQLVCGLPQAATPKQVQARSRRWRPHRSLASIYLWNAVKLNLTPSDIKGRKKAA